MKCFLKENSIIARHYEYLSHMAVDEEQSSCCLEYTQMWIKRVSLLEACMMHKKKGCWSTNVLPLIYNTLIWWCNILVQSIMSKDDAQILWFILSLDIRDGNQSQEVSMKCWDVGYNAWVCYDIIGWNNKNIMEKMDYSLLWKAYWSTFHYLFMTSQSTAIKWWQVMRIISEMVRGAYL